MNPRSNGPQEAHPPSPCDESPAISKADPNGGGQQLALPRPYLLFLGETLEPGYAKTAMGLRDWARDNCVGELAYRPHGVTTGLPRLTAAEAVKRGARSLVIGVASAGGSIDRKWIPSLVEALRAGLDIVSGMHDPLESVPELKHAAIRQARQLINVRTPPRRIPVGSGRRRSGKRLLTVGTDCAVGKKYTALTLARAFSGRGLDASFRATGQTGIMIAGSGIPIDAVVSDFAAGAAEMLSPDASPGHWDVIEGQGSLFHPAYSGVSLALLHGSQPDVIVLCHNPSRTAVLGCPDHALPSLDEALELNLRLGARTNPGIRCGGICLNTSQLSDEEAQRLLDRESASMNIPVADPMRGGAALEQLVESCLSH